MTLKIESSYQYIFIYLKIGNIRAAEINLENLEKIIIKLKEYNIPSWKEEIRAKFDIGKANLLIYQRSSTTNSEAIKILRKVVANSSIKVELVIDTLLPLIELILQEFKFFQNPATFDEISELFSTLRKI